MIRQSSNFIALIICLRLRNRTVDLVCSSLSSQHYFYGALYRLRVRYYIKRRFSHYMATRPAALLKPEKQWKSSAAVSLLSANFCGLVAGCFSNTNLHYQLRITIAAAPAMTKTVRADIGMSMRSYLQPVVHSGPIWKRKPAGNGARFLNQTDVTRYYPIRLLLVLARMPISLRYVLRLYCRQAKLIKTGDQDGNYGKYGH